MNKEPIPACNCSGTCKCVRKRIPVPGANNSPEANKYIPDYPATLEDAIEMIQGILDEWEELPVKDNYNLGASFALRTAVGILNNLKRNLERK